jgi:predicted AAA+ superfamily ATPase
LRGVSESLAGRAAHLVLRPMTEREKRGDVAPPVWPALLSAGTPDLALAALPAPRALDWRDAALRGGLPPAALADDAADRAVWFDAYADTYLHRDVRDLARIGDLSAFARFLRLVALRTGGLLNVADLARDAALPRTTALRWLSILEATFLVTLLPAFAGNATTRLIKAPKLYSLDTGLSLHLAGVTGAAEIGRMQNAGAWLEQLVLNDLLAWRESEPRKPAVCHSRTASGREADFVVEHGRRMLPIEVKSARAVRVDDARELDALCAASAGRAPFGLLLHDGPEAFRLTRTTIAVPIGAVL